MKKLHLAIDLDDVVVNFMPGVMASFELEFGEHPEYDGRPWGTDAENFAKHERFLAAGYSSWWEWLHDREWLWANFGAVPGAIGGIQTLRAQGHYLEAVTSKPSWAEHNVWKWLGKWRPAFNRVTIVNKTTRKVDVTAADVMVDDKLHNVQEFLDAGRQGILFDRSRLAYRADGTALTGRVAWHWDHVLEHIGEIANDE